MHGYIKDNGYENIGDDDERDDGGVYGGGKTMCYKPPDFLRRYEPVERKINICHLSSQFLPFIPSLHQSC